MGMLHELIHVKCWVWCLAFVFNPWLLLLFVFHTCGASSSPTFHPLRVLGYINLSTWKGRERLGELESTIFFRVSPIYKEWAEGVLNIPSLFHTFTYGVACCPLCKILEGNNTVLPVDDSWTQTQRRFLDTSGERKARNDWAIGKLNFDFGVGNV